MWLFDKTGLSSCIYAHTDDAVTHGALDESGEWSTLAECIFAGTASVLFDFYLLTLDATISLTEMIDLLTPADILAAGRVTGVDELIIAYWQFYIQYTTFKK